MEFAELIRNSRNGGAVLFCGAGFSGDCLGLTKNDELGAGSALLALLNNELKSETVGPYKELKNAADKFMQLRGEHGLLGLMKDKFKVARISDEMSEILSFTWNRIYTTNYDNAIQLACTRANRNFKTLNNLDVPDAVPGSGTEIVHLHGCAEKWDIHNFRRSCVLGAESYFEAEKSLGHWTARLQDDFERSRIFVFVGFAAGDFHLNRVFFNAQDSRPKVFFVNLPSAQQDPDLQSVQEKFGKPLSIGRSGLAGIIRNSRSNTDLLEPFAPSYRLYSRPSAAGDIPSVESIRNLFIFGEVDETQIIRDISRGRSDYHVLRTITDDLIKGINSDKPATLITGEICDGKSIVVQALCARLSVSRRVYIVHRPYETIVEETAALIAAHSNPVFLIENCFDLAPTRLQNLLSLFSIGEASIILTSRSISARAEIAGSEKLDAFDFLQRRQIQALDETEIQSLISLSDQIAGWSELPRTHLERTRFIKERCRGSLPTFLLELLRSKFVRDRYSEEFRKTIDQCAGNEIKAIVAALYISHIGHDASVAFLSNVFRIDISSVVGRFKSGVGLRLVHIETGILKTIPSIGASSILREIVPLHDKRLIVDTVVDMLRWLSFQGSGDDYESHVFRQLMRYSILSTVVEDKDERNRFFDNVSKIDRCRTQVLFWVQWHMSMIDQKRFGEAETYLKRSYTEAQAFERRTGKKYDLVQIDDRKAKFLMIRNQHESFKPNMIHDLREACNITERLLRRSDLTHHPFDTFVEIVTFFQVASSKLDGTLRQTCRSWIESVGKIVKEKYVRLEEGYPANRGKRALDSFKEFSLIS